MTANIKMRLIKKEEASLIHQLAAKIWPPSFQQILSAEQISYMINMMYAIPVLKKEIERGVAFYIFSYNETNIGYTAIEKKENNSYKLHKIYLSQQLHGKGFGKYQLQCMENIVKGNGASFLYLNVNRQNKAVEFYKSQGYKIVEEVDNDIGNGYFMNDYVMKKEL